MFRVRGSDVEIRFSVTAVIVILTLVLALGLSGAAVYQVLQEYRLLSAWLALSGPTTDAELETLRDAIGVRIITRSIATTLLILCTLATLWLQRRLLTTRRTLDRVKRFTHDILASIDQGVITTDCSQVISSINTAATLLLGVEAECVDRPLADISSPEVPLLDLARRIADRGESIRDHDCVIDRGGRIRRLRADAHVLREASGRTLGCVMFLRDVSQRLLMEERVRRMEQYLILGNLASGLHHEIKNPLTALSIHVQLLEERLSDPAARLPVQNLIGVLKSEVLRLNGVLESFRNFANLQQLTVRPTDVLGLLEEVLRLIGPQAAQQQVAVDLHHPRAELPRVPLDAEKFKQAVLNLVINALEAMPRGGVLTMSASVRGSEIQVEITDTGPGIPPEVQGELFKPYFSTKRRGTGMGLALTKKLVGQHGGRVEFRTGPCGTTFRLATPTESGMAGGGRP